MPNGSDNCPTVFNLTQSNVDGDAAGDHCDAGDFDGDGYSDQDEARYIGTGAGDPCGMDGWPSNLFDFPPTNVNRLDLQDVLTYVTPVRHYNRSPGETGYNPRWDLVPGPGDLLKYINIQDVTALVAGPSGNPPMFGGGRAFGLTCPFPP